MNAQTREKFKFGVWGRTLIMIDWANVYGWFSDPKSKNYLGWEVDPKRLFDYLSIYPKISDKRLYHGVEPGSKRSEEFGENVKTIGFTFVTKKVKWTPVYLNEQNHFKRIVRELFNVLDGIKITNSNIATKLYELRKKIESRLADEEPDFDSDGNVQGVHPTYTPDDQKIYDFVYELIEELDTELKNLNVNVEELQQRLLEPVQRRKCDFDVELARDVYNLSNDFKTLVLFSGDGDYAALVEDLIAKGKKVIVVYGPGHKGEEYDLLSEKLKKNGKGYALFVCTVNNLKECICVQKINTPRIAPRGEWIPTDFSVGRDIGNIADSGNKSQEPVDKP